MCSVFLVVMKSDQLSLQLSSALQQTDTETSWWTQRSISQPDKSIKKWLYQNLTGLPRVLTTRPDLITSTSAGPHWCSPCKHKMLYLPPDSIHLSAIFVGYLIIYCNFPIMVYIIFSTLYFCFSVRHIVNHF